MIKRLQFTLFFLLSASLISCEKNPISKVVDPAGTYNTGIWSGNWILYDDELKTDGATMVYTQGVSLDFNSTDNPRSGKKCIRFSWDGSPVLTYKKLPAHPQDYVQGDFTGFGLICAKTLDEYFTGTRDLSAGGYTKLTFWARGHLFDHVYLRVEANSDDANFSKIPSGTAGVWEGVVGPDWQKYTVTLDKNYNSLAAAKDFVKVILAYDDDGDPTTANTTSSNNGGTVFLDDIQLSN
jgi:hypothetical protein